MNHCETSSLIAPAQSRATPSSRTTNNGQTPMDHIDTFHRIKRKRHGQLGQTNDHRSKSNGRGKVKLMSSDGGKAKGNAATAGRMGAAQETDAYRVHNEFKAFGKKRTTTMLRSMAATATGTSGTMTSLATTVGRTVTAATEATPVGTRQRLVRPTTQHERASIRSLRLSSSRP